MTFHTKTDLEEQLAHARMLLGVIEEHIETHRRATNFYVTGIDPDGGHAHGLLAAQQRVAAIETQLRAQTQKEQSK